MMTRNTTLKLMIALPTDSIFNLDIHSYVYIPLTCFIVQYIWFSYVIMAPDMIMPSMILSAVEFSAHTTCCMNHVYHSTGFICSHLGKKSRIFRALQEWKLGVSSFPPSSYRYCLPQTDKIMIRSNAKLVCSILQNLCAESSISQSCTT